MKKMISILLAVLMVAAIACTASADPVPQPEGGQKFESVWVIGGGLGAITYEEEGYKILVREVEGENVKETEYSAFYHEDDNTVVSLEGDAVFSKNEDGCMVWNGIVFERLDPPSEEEANN